MKLTDSLNDTDFKRIEEKLLKQDVILKLDSEYTSDFFRNQSIPDIIHLILKKQKDVATLESWDKGLNFTVQPIGRYRRRSVGDIFLLVKYYHPTVTFKDIRKALVELLENNMITSDYCSNIQKRVYWVSNNLLPLYSITIPDEYNSFYTYD